MNPWPTLPVDAWQPTRDTLHMWLQIVGKTKMVLSPPLNHWWHVTLHVSASGLSTGLIPVGDGACDIEFDFVAHRLHIRRDDGRSRSRPLTAMSVAEFYRRFFDDLADLDIEVRIHGAPNEVVTAIPFADDTVHDSYDPEHAHLFWRQLLAAHHALQRFRGEFRGKVSPVHFFWGAMDLAVTRFSGKRAPEHPGGAPNCPRHVMVEGYSHELSSAGFWPGGSAEGSFYSYAYPAPPDFARAARPAVGGWDDALQEYVLPFDAARTTAEPENAVLEFLRATYAVADPEFAWSR